MPELPEAETIARRLHEVLAGQLLCGHGRLRRVWRYGKCVLFDFDSERMIARLGMTGSLRLNADPGPYTRSIFQFDRALLLYNDIRKFGRIEWSADLPKLGPDILTVSAEQFAQLLVSKTRAIKAVLLDQSFVSGLGNIYVDESLHRAHVHPAEPANRVNSRRLLESIHETLQEAILHGGSTISDFEDPFGQPGGFQQYHRVYAREGVSCTTCGEAILRTVVAQRGTHYCPRCQPQPSPPAAPKQPARRPQRRPRSSRP